MSLNYSWLFVIAILHQHLCLPVVHQQTANHSLACRRKASAHFCIFTSAVSFEWRGHLFHGDLVPVAGISQSLSWIGFSLGHLCTSITQQTFSRLGIIAAVLNFARRLFGVPCNCMLIFPCHSANLQTDIWWPTYKIKHYRFHSVLFCWSVELLDLLGRDFCMLGLLFCFGTYCSKVKLCFRIPF